MIVITKRLNQVEQFLQMYYLKQRIMILLTYVWFNFGGFGSDTAVTFFRQGRAKKTNVIPIVGSHDVIPITSSLIYVMIRILIHIHGDNCRQVSECVYFK